MKTGIVVFAHGSSMKEANDAVYSIAAEVARVGGYDLLETAFLDCTQPDLPASVARLVEKGAVRIVVVPYFLTLGKHLQRDLPRIVEDLSRIHQGVKIEVTEPLDGDPALAQILLARARQALGQ